MKNKTDTHLDLNKHNSKIQMTSSRSLQEQRQAFHLSDLICPFEIPRGGIWEPFRKVGFYWKQYLGKWNRDTQSLSSFLATAECGTRWSVIFDLEQEFLFFAPSEDLFYTFHALRKDQHIWFSRHSCEANVTATLQMKQLSPEHWDLIPQPSFRALHRFVRLWEWSWPLRLPPTPFQTQRPICLLFHTLFGDFISFAMGGLLFLEASLLMFKDVKSKAYDPQTQNTCISSRVALRAGEF